MVHNNIKKIGIICGLKKEMNLVSLERDNIFCTQGYGSFSEDAAKDLLKKNVDIILNFGFVGSLTNKINNGDVILVKEVFNENKKKLTCDTSNSYFIEKLKKFNYIKSNLLTVQKLVNSNEDKCNLTKLFPNAKIVDMEAFFILNQLRKNKIPMISVKIVFDDLSFNLPRFLNKCIDKNGNLKFFNLTLELFKKPNRLLKLYQLRKYYVKSKKVLKDLIRVILT